MTYSVLKVPLNPNQPTNLCHLHNVDVDNVVLLKPYVASEGIL